MKRLTKRQKELAGEYKIRTSFVKWKKSSKEEVREAKSLARGHYWYSKYNCYFVSYSTSGRVRWFDTYITTKNVNRYSTFLKIKFAAKLWCKGNYKKSIATYNEAIKRYEFKGRF